MANLEKQAENIRKFGVPLVVAINRFPTDTDAEIELVSELCGKMGVPWALSEVWAKGGEGGFALAEELLKVLATEKADFQPLYSEKLPIKEKIGTIAREIYGADGVEYTKEALKATKHWRPMAEKCPFAWQKPNTPYLTIPVCWEGPGALKSLFGNQGFSGAGFVVAITGDMTMPGLPKIPQPATWISAVTASLQACSNKKGRRKTFN